MSDFIDKISGIQKSWHTWLGLVTAEAIIPALALFLKQFDIPNMVNSIICIAIALIILLIWYYTNTLPKTVVGKIGFVVSITCDDEQSHNIIRDDFVITLRKLITSGKTGRFFQFIEIPKHISCKIIDSDDAQKLRVKTRAQFVLYGRSRTRKINSKDHNYIELDGLVAHNPISAAVQQQLSSEFSELLPRKLAIDKESGLFEFELTSEWVELVAKYIIGIAAEVSGDLDYAELLFNEVLSKLSASRKDFPVFSKLKERLPARFAEIIEAKANYYLNAWSITHDNELMDKMHNELSKSDQRSVNIRIIHSKAIYAFVKYRDVNGSILLIKSYPKSFRDAVWHLNLAFLESYKGNLKKALQYYRNAEKLKVDIPTLNQIEGFISYIISIEPDNAQLYFCLGYINWKIKGDILQAIKDYTCFIDTANMDQFSEQIIYAKKWVEELTTIQKT